jgi:ribosomal protein L29
MKTKAEIKERIADLKAELSRMRGLTLTSEEYIDYECIKNEIATLNWVLN